MIADYIAHASPDRVEDVSVRHQWATKDRCNPSETNGPAARKSRRGSAQTIGLMNLAYISALFLATAG
jgi:hypothetical protein